MNTNITTLAQAEQHLRETGIVRTTANFKEVVEGKQLLDVCGFSYTDKNWGQRIQRQIEKHNFIEDIDYVIRKVQSTIDGGAGNRGMKTVYAFTLHAANHVLLAAMTAQGKQARDTAIKAVESQPTQPVMPTTYLEALKHLVAAEEKREALELELVEAQPKIEFFDDVAESDNLFSMKEAADIIGHGRNTLFEILRDHQVFTGKVPYRQYIERGYFEVKVSNAHGAIPVTKVTGKGLQWLVKNFGNK